MVHVPDAGWGALHGLAHDHAGLSHIHLLRELIAGGSEGHSSKARRCAGGDGSHVFLYLMSEYRRNEADGYRKCESASEH